MATVSTHVLDTARGAPASGVRVRLSAGGRELGAGVTDAGGRIADLAGEVPPGPCRLSFELDGPGLYRAVHLDVTIGEGHHHLPLLLAPFGVTAYRGA